MCCYFNLQSETISSQADRQKGKRAKRAVIHLARRRKNISVQPSKVKTNRKHSHIIFWIPVSRSVRAQQWTEWTNMAHNKFAVFVLFFLCNLTGALTDTAPACYRLEPGTIAGIICADVLLTLIIVVVTYKCASFRRQKLDNADKVYMNVRNNCKS
ncbi:hypothetical protein INR49_024204 [Caranx melampygus]|nr:hypothetical protein INR49_024204 [Caranx melampygus]